MLFAFREIPPSLVKIQSPTPCGRDRYDPIWRLFSHARACHGVSHFSGGRAALRGRGPEPRGQPRRESGFRERVVWLAPGRPAGVPVCGGEDASLASGASRAGQGPLVARTPRSGWVARRSRATSNVLRSTRGSCGPRLYRPFSSGSAIVSSGMSLKEFVIQMASRRGLSSIGPAASRA